ncbi:CobW family GTP-binding protein [Paractinoplanes durhamensis]
MYGVSTRTAPTPTSTATVVTVLAGFSASATLAVADSLLRADDRLLLVQHDISEIRSGTVRRVVRDAHRILEDVTVTVVHGCVACTLREDVLPTLARLGRRHPRRDLLLALPPAIEPESVAAACRHVPAARSLRFDSYVTVVDAATFVDDLCDTADLSDRDLHAAHDDRRAVAQVVARQIEFADTVVGWSRATDTKAGWSPATDTEAGRGQAGGAYEAGRLTALVHRLAPWVTYVRDDVTGLRGTGRHDPSAPGMTGRALEGRPIGVNDPAGSFGASSMLFDSRRPFHPERLHRALPALTHAALRGRGQLWIASRPDAVIAWESAGQGISLGPLGSWLAAVPPDRRHEPSDLRRLAADATWDPYYGDRRTALAFIGLDLDTTGLHDLLTACLLTDTELAAGTETWPHLNDPFADYFPLDHTPKTRP